MQLIDYSVGDPAVWGRVIELILIELNVPVLLVIGYKLFKLGATGQMNLSGRVLQQGQISITNLAPGSLCFVLGVVLGGALVSKGLHETTALGRTDFSAMTVAPVPGPATVPSDVGAPGAQVATVRPSPTPAVSERVTTTSTSSTTTDFLNGRQRLPPLSVRLSLALTSLAACQKASKPNVDCDAVFYGQFNQKPNSEELDQIKKLEKKAAAGDKTAIKQLQSSSAIYER